MGVPRMDGFWKIPRKIDDLGVALMGWVKT